MTTQTQTSYRPTATATPGVGGLLRLIGAIILIAIVVGWLMSSYRAGKVIAPDEPLPAQDPIIVQTYQIPTGNPDLPELSFSVETAVGGYSLIDPDGDVFFCESMPATLASLRKCTNTSAAAGEGVTFGVR